MGNPVVHFEIASQDGQRLREFYQALFGWKIAPSNTEGYGSISTGGGAGIDGSLHEEQHGPIEITFYVEVPDLEAALQEAERVGGKTILAPVSIGGDRTLAQIEDPEGHVIGLLQR